MRLALDSDTRIHLVRSYGGGELVIGAEHIRRPCLVSPDRLMLDWAARSFAELSDAGGADPAALEALLQFGAGIVLLGSGESQPMPSTALRAVFQARGIALECMNLGAACRTYNILASEQRAVLAGLFP
ncbi:MAG TPA: MTH938/NDUFAF3 family protein [Steroidobacteraceae bacterium]|nr:MTH938/NDUFAF3 family protein [Steroidobacteraceae bacterium]